MNINQLFHTITSNPQTYALPILSFPAMQKLGVTVREMLH